jgi:hypothetical protein
MLHYSWNPSLHFISQILYQHALPLTIFAVRGYTPEDVVGAVERTSWAREPTYSLERSIKQLMLEDYVRVRGHSEISWREILAETKVHCGGYSHLDITNLVTRELSREGVRIWR